MMRTIVLFILLALEMGVYANTGSYRPFVKEGKTWKCTMSNAIGRKCKLTYTMKGDTIINETPCKKLYCKYEYDSGNVIDEYTCGVYEQNKKVYFIYSRDKANKAHLLFDFGLALGDTIINDGYGKYKITVLRVDTVMNSYNQFFRRMLIRTGAIDDDGFYLDKPPYVETFWVEGVGRDRRPTDSYFWWNDSTPGLSMDACYEDGECIMTYSEMITEGTSGVNSATATQPQASFIYDLQGRRLKEQPRKGLYIQNGRKVVVKQ